ncbi:MAG: DUF4474 domain-containing protein [Clostridia bacterium]|nr:DUF4474 domain-containing protein [Clostridia bacterium]
MKNTVIVGLAAFALLAGAVFARMAAGRHFAPEATQEITQTATQQTAAEAATSAAATKSAGRPATVSIARITAARATAGQRETAVARPAAATATGTTARADRHALMRNPYLEDTLYYTNDRDCWQLQSESGAADKLRPPESAMYLDQVRIAFSYAGKTWLIQMRKGQNGYLLLGGEICLCTAPADACTGAQEDLRQFAVPETSDWLQMSMELRTSRDGGATYLTDVRPYETHWLMDGYRKGQLTEFAAPREEVRIGARITFKTPEMAAAFAAELAEAGFKEAPAKDRLTGDSYCLDGADVFLLWKTVEYDCYGSPNAEK